MCVCVSTFWVEQLEKFHRKAYSVDTIPAGKHNKLPEFQDFFCTDENSRRERKTQRT